MRLGVAPWRRRSRRSPRGRVRVRVTVRVRVRVTFTVRVTFRVRVTVRAGIDHLEVGLHPPREEVGAAKHALERPVLKVLVRVRVEVGVRRWN